MAEIQQALAGHVMVFGPPSGTLKAGTTGIGTTLAVMLTAFTLSKTAQRLKTPNAAGETVNITTFNRNLTATCTVRPLGAARSNAIAAAIATPNPGDCLYAITDASPTTWTDTEWTAADPGLEWSVVSCTKTGSSGAHVEYELVLEREGATTDYTQIA
jgi:hypothetical protein